MFRLRLPISFVMVTILIGLLSLAGCDTEALAPATFTPTASRTFIAIPASATIDPILPTAQSSGSNGVNNADAREFTPAAPPVSNDDQKFTITPPPQPTQSTIPLQIVAGDGLPIIGTYYGAATHPSPAVLLLHMNSSNRDSWQFFATQLQQSGFNVLAVDLRGFGDTGGQVDWTKAAQDVGMVLNRLRSLSGVDPNRVSVMGASIGANLAVNACASQTSQPGCSAVVLLSPALDYLGVKTANAVVVYGKHPLFIAASRDDVPTGTDSSQLDSMALGEHRLILYNGSSHGTDLLKTQTDLTGIIIQWLTIH